MSRLVAFTGSLAGSTIFLYDAPVTIGRDLSNDINIKEAVVSRRHCVVTKVGDTYKINDCNSANGTNVTTA